MNIEKTYNVDIKKSIRYKNPCIIIAHNEGNIFLELAHVMTLMEQTQ